MDENPGAMWKEIVAGSLSQSSSLPLSRRNKSANVKLSLFKRPAPKHLLGKTRNVAMIQEPLRKVIHEVIAGEAPWPLVLTGEAGTGKTCAALCLLDHAGGDYYTTAGLCETLIRSQQGRLEWNQEGRGGTIYPEMLWSRIAGQRLIVLDELGCREKVSDAHYDAVKRMIDERDCKPFIVISNLSLKQIGERYDGRIFSRLAAGTVENVTGEDRRLAC